MIPPQEIAWGREPIWYLGVSPKKWEPDFRALVSRQIYFMYKAHRFTKTSLKKLDLVGTCNTDPAVSTFRERFSNAFYKIKQALDEDSKLFTWLLNHWSILRSISFSRKMWSIPSTALTSDTPHGHMDSPSICVKMVRWPRESKINSTMASQKRRQN